jgi:phage tail-like protein
MAELTKDVYRGFKFSVEIDGFKRAAFQKVSGLKTSIEVVEYREGNMPDRMEKLSGMMTYDTITLERGVSYDNDFNEWMSSVCNVQGGGDIPSGGGPDFGANSYRKSVKITLYNKQGVAVKEFKLINAFPSEYEVGDLDATSNDVLISTLVLQHHGIIETNLAS